MVELMVAMVLSLLIALVAIAALTASRRGFSTVDAASELRDNGRLISELIQRIGVQAGFKDVGYAAGSRDTSVDVPPNVFGFNNALINAADPLNASVARATADGSDVLILRYQLVKQNESSTAADGSMIDCMGNTVTTGGAPSSPNERMASIFSVDESTGEPSLMCTTVNPKTGAISTQPIIRGVETFQVLYGTHGVTAGTAPATTYGLTANAPAPTTSADWYNWVEEIDRVPDHYYRADQLTVDGNAAATNANWRRVRSLRIGIVLRGPANSAQTSGTQTIYPFGTAKASASAAIGTALSAASDPGSIFSAPADGRLRQVVTFTVHLRNSQML